MVLVPPAGIEPATCPLGNRKPDAEAMVFEEVTGVACAAPADSPAPAHAATLCQRVREPASDPELALIVRAWPALSPAVRAALVEMIRAVGARPR